MNNNNLLPSSKEENPDVDSNSNDNDEPPKSRFIRSSKNNHLWSIADDSMTLAGSNNDSSSYLYEGTDLNSEYNPDALRLSVSTTTEQPPPPAPPLPYRSSLSQSSSYASPPLPLSSSASLSSTTTLLLSPRKLRDSNKQMKKPLTPLQKLLEQSQRAPPGAPMGTPRSRHGGGMRRTSQHSMASQRSLRSQKSRTVLTGNYFVRSKRQGLSTSRRTGGGGGGAATAGGGVGGDGGTRHGSQGSSGMDFAVQNIQRGSESWTGLIKPFVSDLAFRSLLRRRYQSEVSFRPYRCQAAVLFVDLSGYSKITAAIAHRGAHFLSSVVNAYLEQLIKIIYDAGGDCVKFAGDAVLAVWEATASGADDGDGDNNDSLRRCVLCAAHCAMEIQRKAGTYPVEGTDLAFSTHCGLSCGKLESEIFVAPTSVNMQRLYHSVGGEAINAVGDLVDCAKAGEVCVGRECIDIIGDNGTFRPILGAKPSCTHKILSDMYLDRDFLEIMEDEIEKAMADRLSIRRKLVEEDFIHPSVLTLLSHGGLSPTQIAQMRNLCVLFIAMTSKGSSVNWLMEVQGLLDKNRCPIVQIIDDDKGVHVVAAVNLYETIPEANILGLEVARALIDQEVGCSIGIAAGTTFCGVTGSNLACRWDITGAPVVRAARLMQYALSRRMDVAIDESLYLDPTTGAKLKLVESGVSIKGSPEPCSIYCLSEANMHLAFRVLETDFGRCHDEKVDEIVKWITRSDRSRCAVLVKGPPFAGKKIVCQRASGFAEMVPFLHVCDPSFGLLQLARSIASWFKYNQHSSVVRGAEHIFQLMNEMKWCRAHDACIALVDEAIQLGVRACFLIDRIQFLDEFSLSLIKECLSRESNTSVQGGKVCFLCVHVTLYNHLSADHIIEDITRMNKKLQVPVVEVVEAQSEELRTMFKDVFDVEVEDRWLRSYGESSGNCAGYFMQRAETLRNLSAKLWKDGKPGYAVTTEDLVLSIPPGYLRRNKEVKVVQISTDVSMRFAQLYDDLPPLFQLFTKVLQVATRTGLFKPPRHIMWEALNDLIAAGVESEEMEIVVSEMVEMYLVVIDEENGEDVLSFRTPALGDIAMDVCTPVQIRTISRALLERLDPIKESSFKVPLVLADLQVLLGQDLEARSLWRQGYKALTEASTSWSLTELDLWKEIIDDEIQGAGFKTSDILGEDFSYPAVVKPSVGTELPLLNVYRAPVAFGPMGHSLTVICRNIFHEYGIFHNSSTQDSAKLLSATQTAAERYLVEIDVVDSFLAQYGFRLSNSHRDAERGCIEYLATPAESDKDVISKAWQFSNVYIPLFVEDRLQNLRQLVEKLRQGPILDVVKKGQTAIRRAYEALVSDKCRNDAAQEALLIMASMNWKPRDIPEYLPSSCYQTVARLRTAVLRRLNESELAVLIHQQNTSDLESFLIVTPLLYSSQEVNDVYFRQLCG